ncbi:MAG: hypothetical protein KA003_11475 [Caldilineaceae bacterium]|nr:hypothetical protein [Caldilineaceae bacterium]
MLANAAAITMRAEPGMELACQGKNFNLPPGPHAQPRGVLSHYATVTLSQAVKVGDWLDRIHTAVQADQDAGLLPHLYGLELQSVGRWDMALPGIDLENRQS